MTPVNQYPDFFEVYGQFDNGQLNGAGILYVSF
jgi:hypothetical protein